MKKVCDWGLFGALIIALMPFLLGVLMFEAYGPSPEPITCCDLTSLNADNTSLDSGKITYVAVTSLHFFVCAIVILRYWTRLCDGSKIRVKYCSPVVPGSSMSYAILSKAAKVAKAALAMLPSIGPVVLVFMLLWSIFHLLCKFQGSYYKLATGFMLEIYGIPDICGKCSPSAQSVFSQFEFHVASTLPVVAAAVAVAFLVGYASLQVRLFGDSKEHEFDSRYSDSYRSIMECLPMCSCVLVTAVISSAVWFHLPIKIFGGALRDSAALQNLQNYGDEMTLFLGVTYTLTALVAIAWPIWRLSRRAHKEGYNPEAKSDWQWTNRELLFLLNKVLAVLAPLITSLLYNLLGASD